MGDVVVAVLKGGGLMEIVRASGDTLLRLCHNLFNIPIKKRFLSVPMKLNLQTQWGEAEAEGVSLLFGDGCSYTREEMVEFHLPRGPATQYVLERLLEAGARYAGPGEFTMRAFLNGRITLAQAEAINALIRAETESQRRAALSNLLHATGQKIQNIFGEIQNLRAEVEAQLDFPDDEIEEADLESIAERIEKLRRRLCRLSDSRDGDLPTTHIIITGPPNAGKSSILNRLAGRDVAVVHDTPGTTRDWVETEIDLDGRRIVAVDTPGVGGQFDKVVSQLRYEADIILEVVGVDQIEQVGLPKPDEGKIIVLNKIDLGVPSEVPDGVLCVSALTGEGIEKLKKTLKDVAVSVPDIGGIIVEVIKCLEEAAKSIIWGIELTAEYLREAASIMATIMGKEVTEEMLSRIFNRFCVGK